MIANEEHEHHRVLAEAAAVLAASLDYERTLANVGRAIVPRLADHAFVELVGGGEIRRVADKTLGCRGSAEGGTRDEASEGPWSSVLRAPIIADDGERIGTLTACYGRSERKHDARDGVLLEEIARRAAVAIKHARAHTMIRESARRAEQAAHRAEEASRLKDELFANVAHELRTPLSSILGWVSILRETGGGGRAAEVIERNARSQQRILDDMLDVSRTISAKPSVDTEPVDLGAIADDVVESARPAAEAKGVTLRVERDAAGCRLAGDSERLRQVLQNLVANGLDHTSEGGEVVVSCKQSGDRVVLVVEDDGGIEGSHAELGLAIVRHLVDMHGGEIEVESAGPKTGSTVTVTLPVKPFSAPVGEQRRSDASSPRPRGTANRLSGLKILVVEDEADSRDLIELLLETEGATVCAAPSADAALDALERFHADVVVSDIGMPGRDGYWLATELRKQRPDVGAIALTAYSTRDDVARALAAGFDEHLGKPVDPERLVRTLLRVG